jgi:histidinol-phosphate aminotransferase
MDDIHKLVRENVRTLTPYSCARDEFKGKEGVFMDANENPYGSLNRYPDPYQRELKSSIGGIKDIAEENIFLGNGSDEIIDLCFRIFCNPGVDKALTFTPTYGMYEVSAAINNVELIKVPLSEDFQIEPESLFPFLKDPCLKLIFICSPNNPTGNLMKESAVNTILSSFSGIVVIDEAYIDFTERPSSIKLLSRHRNLIVMQTFSKAMGLAAARVGMAFMDSSAVGYFNKMKPPYNISTINQKAALKSLANIDLLKKRIRRIITERERLAKSLKKMSIIEKIFPSDSNFLLVKTKNADFIYTELIDNKIIVRNRNMIVPGCIRITVGTPAENNKLIRTLRTFKL